MEIGIIDTLKEQGEQYLGNITEKASQINWTSPSWDLFILVFFVGAVVLFMFSLSRERIFNILISTYVTLAVMKSFDDLIKGWSINWLWQIFIFLIVLIIITALLSRLSIGAGSGLASLLQIFYFSVLQSGLLITMVISFFPKEIIFHLFPLTKVTFASNIAQLIWFLLPILSLVFVRRK